MSLFFNTIKIETTTTSDIIVNDEGDYEMNWIIPNFNENCCPYTSPLYKHDAINFAFALTNMNGISIQYQCNGISLTNKKINVIIKNKNDLQSINHETKLNSFIKSSKLDSFPVVTEDSGFLQNGSLIILIKCVQKSPNALSTKNNITSTNKLKISLNLNQKAPSKIDLTNKIPELKYDNIKPVCLTVILEENLRNWTFPFSKEKHLYQNVICIGEESFGFSLLQINDINNIILVADWIKCELGFKRVNLNIEIVNVDANKNITSSFDITVGKNKKRQVKELNYGWDSITEENGFIVDGLLKINSKIKFDPNKFQKKSTASKWNMPYRTFNSDSQSREFLPLKKKIDDAFNLMDDEKAAPAERITKPGFAGLINQGATCYMNSALQALFHTSAFRILVYSMPTTGEENIDKSIPLALQRLFYEMQRSPSASNTQQLTKSFGWNPRDIGTQHDIQEFIRVIIDNLESKLKETPLEKAIRGLFGGTARNYFRCTEVNYESSRFEEYYDLQLQVDGIRSLEDSFKKYVEPEKLEGNDQYQTEEFGKQDALMGHELVNLPSVLTLHLQRFVYDLQNGRMKKVNSFFSFPETLDLEPYLAADADRSKGSVYDLYGVLVHHGGTYGGHYVAFIKSEDKWYKFNDSTVTAVSKDQAIDDNFGGEGRTANQKTYSAYLLMYVRHNEIDEVLREVTDADVPQHIIDNYNAHPPVGIKAPSTLSKTFTLYIVDDEDVRVAALQGAKAMVPLRPDEVLLSKQLTEREVVGIVRSLIGKPEAMPYRLDAYRKPSIVLGDGTTKPFVSSFQITPSTLYISDAPTPDGATRYFVKMFIPRRCAVHYAGVFFTSNDSTGDQVKRDLLEFVGLPAGTEFSLLSDASQAYPPKPIKPDTALKTQYPSCFLVMEMGPDFDMEVEDPIPADYARSKFVKTLDEVLKEQGFEPKGKEEDDKENKDVDKEKKDDEKLMETIDITAHNIMSYIDFVSKDDVCDIDIFESTGKQLIAFRVPVNIKFDALVDETVKRCGIDYDRKSDAAIVYKHSGKDNIIQVDTNTYPMATYMFKTNPSTFGLKRHRIYIEIIKGITLAQLKNITQYTVFISEDGVNLTCQKVKGQKQLTVFELWKLVEKGDRIPASAFRMYENRFYSPIKAHEEAVAYNPIAYFMVSPVVPEGAILVQFAYQVDEKNVSYPAITYVNPNETIAEFRPRVEELLNRKFEGGQFSVKDIYGVKVPTEKTCLSNIVKIFSYILWRAEAEKKSSLSRSNSSGIKIFN